MDYASIYHFLISKGFVKLNTTNRAITLFKTVFHHPVENKTININWELGGYVSKISSEDMIFSSETFFETFFETFV